MSRERPILMSEPMVLAILAEAKLQTRRPVKKVGRWNNYDVIQDSDGGPTSQRARAWRELFAAELARLEAGYRPENLRAIYEAVRPWRDQVRWRDGFQRILNVDSMGNELGAEAPY